MKDFSSEITQELLNYIDIPNINVEAIQYVGLPIAHNIFFPVDEIISGVHGLNALLISKIWQMRTGKEQKISVNLFHAYLSLSSFLFLRVNGYTINPPDPKYPTIGIYKAKDQREIFLHGGYPALRDKILRVLEVPNEIDYIQSAVNKWDAKELEEEIAKVEGCAAMVRTRDEWLAHPQGKILNSTPLLRLDKLMDTTPENLKDGIYPLSGIRVLDLTHVLAAPTCGRVLAEFGAQVLHLSAPHNPSIAPFAMDTSHGKRQAYIDLRKSEDLNQFKFLLSQADVFIEGWRPGRMVKFGLSPQDVQKIRPGIIHVTYSCYGREGPWCDRAGWEQLGQTVCGIVSENKIDLSQSHGVFICDYLSGYLGAAGVLAGLIKRHQLGGGYHIHIALSRCGMWAISKPPIVHQNKRTLRLPLSLPEYQQFLTYFDHGPYGKVEFLSSPIQLSLTPPRYVLPPSPRGSGIPAWQDF